MTKARADNSLSQTPVDLGGRRRAGRREEPARTCRRRRAPASLPGHGRDQHPCLLPHRHHRPYLDARPREEATARERTRVLLGLERWRRRCQISGDLEYLDYYKQ